MPCGCIGYSGRIENGVFRVRDVTLGEDGCRMRTGGAPMILSTMRNVVLKGC